MAFIVHKIACVSQCPVCLRPFGLFDVTDADVEAQKEMLTHTSDRAIDSALARQ